jgi:hypothetical protein
MKAKYGLFFSQVFRATVVVFAAAIFSFSLLGCPTDGGGNSGGGGDALLEVTHVNGFQGKLSDGSLIEIEVANTADGNQNFTLYVKKVKKGTGTLTINGGSITAILNCTDSSLTYSGGVCYRGIVIPLRPADGKVWVHWGVYAGATMTDFNNHARQYNGDAYQMYIHRPSPDDQGYYYGSPYAPVYDTPKNIYDQARRDYPEDGPDYPVFNQAIRALNDGNSTGVGAYVSRGNLIAYYFLRVRNN